MKRWALPIIVWAAVWAWLQLALPWTARAQETPKSQTQAGSRISDRDLRAFAKVYVEYQALQREYGAKIERAKDPKEKDALQKEGSAKLKVVLQKQRLAADQYNRIFTAVNRDKKLREKVLSMVEAERKKP